MEDRDFTDEPETGHGGRGWFRWFFVLVILGALGTWMFWPRGEGDLEETPEPPEVFEVPSGSRSVTLVFASADAEGFRSENREVAVNQDFLDQVAAVLRELSAGPVSEGAVSCLPSGTNIEEVFLDEDRRILYIDFNHRLVSGHPGGSSGEYFTIASVVRTVAANFPEIAGVQFLVGGLEIETLAGHMAADEPFWVDDWR